jgi:molecular chaperone DnaK
LCEYEILDSGNIVLDVSVPSIAASFQRNNNLYSRREGAIDYTKAARRVRDDAAIASQRLVELERCVSDPTLAAVRERLDRAMSIALDEANPETTKQAMDDVDKAKELLARVRRANLKVTRRAELARLVQQFDHVARRFAKPSEETSFDLLTKSAELAIDDPRPEFESFAKQLNTKRIGILHRQDWFIVQRFNWLVGATHLFADADAHDRLVAEGRSALAGGDAERVRNVVREMDGIALWPTEADDLITAANIARG